VQAKHPNAEVMGSRMHQLTTLSAVAVAFLLVIGCGGNDSPKQAETVHVTEADFRISIVPNRVASGDLRLLVQNRGPDAHEFIVVRSRGSHLPLRRDGVTVDEEALEKATVGVLEPGSPGSLRRLSMHLDPGHYEVICNMSGHYLGGMHTGLIVE
jgi:uncharacterized cupredoxin-like copper-binding protein